MNCKEGNVEYNLVSVMMSISTFPSASSDQTCFTLSLYLNFLLLTFFILKFERISVSNFLKLEGLLMLSLLLSLSLLLLLFSLILNLSFSSSMMFLVSQISYGKQNCLKNQEDYQQIYAYYHYSNSVHLSISILC